DQYVLYAHKAYKFAKYIQRCAEVQLYSDLPPSEVQAIHLIPCNEPQRTICEWLKEEPNARILFLDEANKLALVRQSSQ
ncbi:MAG: hypothetical protein D6820_12455, partial [Lentisphaerae bacterium]